MNAVRFFKTKTWLAWILLAVLAVWWSLHAGCSNPSKKDIAEAPGKPVPDFVLEGIDGHKVKIQPSRLKKTMAVYLFDARDTGWQEELALLQRLYNAHKNRQDFALIAVVMAHPDAAQIVAPYAVKQNINYPIGKDVGQVFWTLSNTPAVPRLFLVGRDGRLYATFFHRFSPDSFRKVSSAVKKLLDEKYFLKLSLAVAEKLYGNKKRAMAEAMPSHAELLKKIRQVDADKLKSWLDKKRKFRLFFVGYGQDRHLTPRIPGAIFMDAGLLNDEARLAAYVKGLNPKELIILYCGCPPDTFGMSGQAALLLEKMGFKNVYSLKGHLAAWQKKGFPVEALPQLRKSEARGQKPKVRGKKPEVRSQMPEIK
ncbi:MAG: rhodanese-like domain-containing protein [bacterium]